MTQFIKPIARTDEWVRDRNHSVIRVGTFCMGEDPAQERRRHDDQHHHTGGGSSPDHGRINLFYGKISIQQTAYPNGV